MIDEGMARSWWISKRNLELAQEAFDENQTRLVEAMKKEGQRHISVADDEFVVSGTLVEGVRVKIDEAKLKKALGGQLWMWVAKTVLDKAKLEKAMAEGKIDPNTVAAVSEEVDVKPYVKASVSKSVAKVRRKSPAAKKVGVS